MKNMRKNPVRKYIDPRNDFLDIDDSSSEGDELSPQAREYMNSQRYRDGINFLIEHISDLYLEWAERPIGKKTRKKGMTSHEHNN